MYMSPEICTTLPWNVGSTCNVRSVPQQQSNFVIGLTDSQTNPLFDITALPHTDLMELIPCCAIFECSSRTDGGAAPPPVPAERRVRWRVPAPPAMRVARASAAFPPPIIALIIACKARSGSAAALGCMWCMNQGPVAEVEVSRWTWLHGVPS